VAKHVVGPVASLPPGTRQHVEIEGRGIVVFNVDGTFYALRDVCPHQGARLSPGLVVKWLEADEPGCYRYDPNRAFVRCPWHGWEYELSTGRSFFDPVHNRVRGYRVSVEPGKNLVEDGSRQPGPYTAETISISIEDDYVVIEM
jgi:3-phenylpropionate/trans-cinnamate dioxygenase ferredoxin subunit